MNDDLRLADGRVLVRRGTAYDGLPLYSIKGDPERLPPDKDERGDGTRLDDLYGVEVAA